jgi:NO-binding membrane sensor protein with MHYT domain
MPVSPTTFDSTLEALAFSIAIFGCWCGLVSIRSAARRQGAAGIIWLVGASVALGGGAIWAMQFIALLSYDSPASFTIDWAKTVESGGLAVLGTFVGLMVARSFRGVGGRFLGGALMGASYVGMHYLGVSALNYHGVVIRDSQRAAEAAGACVVLGVVLALVAFSVRRLAILTFAGIVLGSLFTAVQLFALTSMNVVLGNAMEQVIPGTEPFSVALPIFGAAGVLLLLMMVVPLFDDETIGAQALPA